MDLKSRGLENKPCLKCREDALRRCLEVENMIRRSCGNLNPPLVAVAHGSRHRCASENAERLLSQVRQIRPDLEITLCFLERTEPSFFKVIEQVSTSSVVVPLILSRGFHVFSDIQVNCSRISIRSTPPLGPDPVLSEVIMERLVEAGIPLFTPLLLAAAGSSCREGAEDVESAAQDLSHKLDVPVEIGYLNGRGNSANKAAQKLRSEFGEFAIAPYLLSPGNFISLANLVEARWIASPLGSHRKIAKLILMRYDHALASD